MKTHTKDQRHQQLFMFQVSKHLCGAATDLSLRCLTSTLADVQSELAGILIGVLLTLSVLLHTIRLLAPTGALNVATSHLSKYILLVNSTQWNSSTVTQHQDNFYYIKSRILSQIHAAQVGWQNFSESTKVPRRPCFLFIPSLKISDLCGPILNFKLKLSSPQPCVATTDVTGDLTWAKSSLRSKASLKPTSSSSPPLPPGALAVQAARDCVKILRKHLSLQNCLKWSRIVQLRSLNLLQKMEEPSMQITGTDTQGSSWTRPPGRRSEDRQNESLTGEDFATWRRSHIWMWNWSIIATLSSPWRMHSSSVHPLWEMVLLASETILGLEDVPGAQTSSRGSTSTTNDSHLWTNWLPCKQCIDLGWCSLHDGT